jgi:hypothetical protein
MPLTPRLQSVLDRIRQLPEAEQEYWAVVLQDLINEMELKRSLVALATDPEVLSI